MGGKRKYIICYLVYVIAWLMLHMFCTKIGDDAGPVSALSYDTYLNGKNNWSSRLFVSFFTIPLKRMPIIVWKCMDTIMIMITTQLLEALFNNNKRLEYTLFIMGMMLLMPFSFFSSAGWITTTVVYLWVITAALYVILIVQRISENQKISGSQYVLSTLLFAYAVDVEIGVVALFLIFGAYSVLQILHKNKNKYVYILTACSFVRILFDIFWKGSASRYRAEMNTWFPDYGMLHIFDRFMLGFFSSAYAVYQLYGILMILLSAMICVVVFETRKDLFVRTVSVVSVIVAGFSAFYFLISEQYENLCDLFSEFNTKYGCVSFSNYVRLDGYIVLLIWGVGLICMIYAVLSIRNSVKKAFIWTAYLTAGIGSRFIMGFSPTVQASSDRTSIWLFAAICICFLGIYTEWVPENVRAKKVIGCSVVFFGVTSFLNNLIFM